MLTYYIVEIIFNLTNVIIISFRYIALIIGFFFNNYSMYYNNDLFIKTFCVKKLNQNSIIQS